MGSPTATVSGADHVPFRKRAASSAGPANGAPDPLLSRSQASHTVPSGAREAWGSSSFAVVGANAGADALQVDRPLTWLHRIWYGARSVVCPP